MKSVTKSLYFLCAQHRYHLGGLCTQQKCSGWFWSANSSHLPFRLSNMNFQLRAVSFREGTILGYSFVILPQYSTIHTPRQTNMEPKKGPLEFRKKTSTQTLKPSNFLEVPAVDCLCFFFFFRGFLLFENNVALLKGTNCHPLA